LRARIVNVLAWFRPDASFASDAEAMTARAMLDMGAGARQLAVRAVGYNHFVRLLPEAVMLLDDPNEGVRSSAAITLGDFGDRARQFLSQLRTALLNETTPLVRRNLENAIAKLSR
jgi:HEAT repeat protein